MSNTERFAMLQQIKKDYEKYRVISNNIQNDVEINCDPVGSSNSFVHIEDYVTGKIKDVEYFKY